MDSGDREAWTTTILEARLKTTYDICCQAIDYLDQPISSEAFAEKYMIPNKPCVFAPFATDNWPCRSNWVTKSGSLNIEHLREKFGHCVVPVANCSKEEFGSHCKEEMTLETYLNYWRKRDDRLLYLKDWHFTKNFPNECVYTTPEVFESDWLNEYCDSKGPSSDDYRFVYIGVAETWCCLRLAVERHKLFLGRHFMLTSSGRTAGLRTYVVKRSGDCIHPVIIGEETKLVDVTGKLTHDVLSVTSESAANGALYYEVVQNVGEIIFVPSGWHHQVWNLEDTVSINHNWFNGCSVDLSWKFLQQRLNDVEREISDVRHMEGWEMQCQLILKVDQGFNYSVFYALLVSIATRRTVEVVKITGLSGDLEPTTAEISDLLSICKNKTKPNDLEVSLTYRAGCSILFDITRCVDVLKMMTNDARFNQIRNLLKPTFSDVIELCELIITRFSGKG